MSLLAGFCPQRAVQCSDDELHAPSCACLDGWEGETCENERDEWPHLAAQCGLSHVSVAWHGPKEQGIERDSERRVELGIDDDD